MNQLIDIHINEFQKTRKYRKIIIIFLMLLLFFLLKTILNNKKKATKTIKLNHYGDDRKHTHILQCVLCIVDKKKEIIFWLLYFHQIFSMLMVRSLIMLKAERDSC